MQCKLTQLDWLTLKEIVDAAILLPAGEREPYIEDACAELPVLRPQVEAMLAAFDGATVNSALIASSFSEMAEVEAPVIGCRLGPYRIVELIGRGGMGLVYRAIRDDDEYRKEVAIKVVSGGFFSSEIRQRFLLERQILANLEHPNIARLLDGGTTKDGLPYVVMEYVSGKPIDAYCREAEGGKGLSLQRRIELMIQVANAVEYAHRHLVVHRDLKPDNIHVTEDGVPKLLDFGIAKALNPLIAGTASGMTVDAARLLTPEFASPEQVKGEAVTTMTDVYQIGLLLNLLLTGKQPFQLTRNMSMAEIERMICHTPAPRPHINRDLDHVILHALEKDPKQRYASAGALADDMERYLHGFPVQARPVSVFYRAGKFVRRNKLAVAAAAALVLLIAGFIFTLATEVGRVKQQRDFADQIANFLVNIFSASDPTHALGRNISARDLLDHGAAEIESEKDLAPGGRDRLLGTLATSYASLGAYRRSLALYRQLLQLCRQRFGEHSPEYAAVLGNIAQMDIAAEHYTDMMNILPRWVALTREVDGLYSRQTESALRVMALDEGLQGNLREAESAAQQALAIAQKLTGGDSPRTLQVYSSLGLIQEYRGQDAQAEATYRTMLKALEKGNWRNSPNMIWILNIRGRLGYVLTEEGRYQQAEALLHNIVASEQKIFGNHNSEVANVEIDTGFLDAATGRFQNAERMMKDAIAIRSSVFGPRSMYLGGDYDELARVYIYEGKYAQVRPLLEKAIANMTQMSDAAGAREREENPVIARVLRHLGMVEMHQHRLAEAEQLLRQALRDESINNSPTSSYVAQDYQTLGEILEAEGKPAAAELDMREALHIYRTTARPYLPSRAITLEGLGALLLKEQQKTAARPILTQAVAILQKELPPAAPALRHAKSLQAKAAAA